MTRIRLRNSDLSLTVSPSNGGGIVSFMGFGEPVLRSASGPLTAPTDLAAFVLVPFCNRIAHGRAEFGGEFFRLTPPVTGELHALHGEGWVSEWMVKAHNATSVELSYRHDPTIGRWPWSFEATQHYELSSNRLVHRLSVTNTSNRPMPAGCGFHPYFPRETGGGFMARVNGKWCVGEDLLPTTHEVGKSDIYWPGGHLMPELPLDNCFTGWDGNLTVMRRKVRVSLTASKELGLLHVYAPPGADFFCAEPVSHMPDAINRPGEPGQMQVLRPGETFEASIGYLVEKTP